MSERKTATKAAALIAAAGMLFFGSAGLAQQQKPKILKPCAQCHAAGEKVLRGNAGSISEKAATIQINTGAVWNLKFDKSTKVMGWKDDINEIPKEKEIAISYIEKDNALYAESISVKSDAKVAPEKLIKADELAALVLAGAGKGGFALVDARPAPKFNEGHIPGAINIYDAQFDKNIAKLPEDKGKLLIFYCAGPT